MWVYLQPGGWGQAVGCTYRLRVGWGCGVYVPTEGGVGPWGVLTGLRVGWCHGVYIPTEGGVGPRGV